VVAVLTRRERERISRRPTFRRVIVVVQFPPLPREVGRMAAQIPRGVWPSDHPASQIVWKVVCSFYGQVVAVKYLQNSNKVPKNRNKINEYLNPSLNGQIPRGAWPSDHPPPKSF